MIYIFPAGKFSLYNQCLSKNENKCLFTPPLKNIHHWGLFISLYFNLQCLLASSEWAEVAFLFFFFSCLFEIIICWRKRNGWLFQDAVRTDSLGWPVSVWLGVLSSLSCSVLLHQNWTQTFWRTWKVWCLLSDFHFTNIEMQHLFSTI